jgi:hypothetical protein
MPANVLPCDPLVQGAVVDGRLVSLYAKRAEGHPGTKLRWTALQLDPPRFGTFADIPLRDPTPIEPHSRPVAARDVHARGRVYAASASDPGEDNNGPFRSTVRQVAQVGDGPDGLPTVVLTFAPQPPAVADGPKIESLTLGERGGAVQAFVGADDEHYSGIVRLLPPALEPPRLRDQSFSRETAPLGGTPRALTHSPRDPMLLDHISGPHRDVTVCSACECHG